MTTAARRLHTLLGAAETAQNSMVRDRWAEVLDAEPYTTSFALRHAAVVALWHETVGVISALPESATRTRRLAYVDAWWNAIVMPQRQWDDGARHQIIDQAALDMLDSTAEYLEELDGERALTPPEDLAALRSEATDWIERVRTAQGLSRGLTTALLENLNNLVWLIDNANRFGTAPVISASERATGGLLRAGIATLQPANWWKALTGLVTATTLVAGGLTQANNMIDQAQHFYAEIESIAHEQPDPDLATPPSVTPTKPRELNAP